MSERPRPAETESRCAAFESRCRGRGVRVTPQRLAVYRALASDATHPTAESVFARLRRSMPSLSQATVYRILNTLEREGLVRRAGSTNGAARFDANMVPHQHLVCRRCGRTTDVLIPSARRAMLPRKGLQGFVPEEVDLKVLGLCAPCGAARRGAPAARRERGVR